MEFASDHDYQIGIKRLGIPDRIVEHGEQPQLHEECGFDKEAIKQAVVELTEVSLVQSSK